MPYLQPHYTAEFSDAESTKHSGERICINIVIETPLASLAARLNHGTTYGGRNGWQDGAHKMMHPYIYRGIQNHILLHWMIGWRNNTHRNPGQQCLCHLRLGTNMLIVTATSAIVDF